MLIVNAQRQGNPAAGGSLGRNGVRAGPDAPANLMAVTPTKLFNATANSKLGAGTGVSGDVDGLKVNADANTKTNAQANLGSLKVYGNASTNADARASLSWSSFSFGTNVQFGVGTGIGF